MGHRKLKRYAKLGTVSYVLTGVQHQLSQEDISINQPMWRRVARDSLRMYFAPLTGAFKGIRHEWRRLDRELDSRRRDEPSKP